MPILPRCQYHVLGRGFKCALLLETPVCKDTPTLRQETHIPSICDTQYGERELTVTRSVEPSNASLWATLKTDWMGTRGEKYMKILDALPTHSTKGRSAKPPSTRIFFFPLWIANPPGTLHCCILRPFYTRRRCCTGRMKLVICIL